jgi:hypothetical protein
MAFKSKSGESYTSPHMMRMADSRHDASMNNSDMNDSMGDSEMDPSDVVAEHGPAKEVMVKHSSDKHEVSSKHSDGHSHKSMHDSMDDAHMAAKTLMGSDDVQEPSQDMEQSEMPSNMAARM